MTRYIMRKRLLSVGDDYDIENEDGKALYKVDGKVRFASTFVLKDSLGNEVASGREKLLSIDQLIHIKRDGRRFATVTKRFINSQRFKFVIDVEGGAGMEARGTFYEDDYKLLRGEALVATVKQQLEKMREIYDVEIVPGDDEVLILAIAAAIVKLVPPLKTDQP